MSFALPPLFLQHSWEESVPTACAASFPAPNLLPFQSGKIATHCNNQNSIRPAACFQGENPCCSHPFYLWHQKSFFFPPVSDSRAGDLSNVYSAKSEQHSGRRTAEIAGSKLSSWNCIWKIGSWVLRGNQVLSFSVSSYSLSFSYYWNCFYTKRGLQNQKRNWFCICYLWVDTF